MGIYAASGVYVVCDNGCGWMQQHNKTCKAEHSNGCQ